MKVLERALELYHPNIALASSFGLEDVALIHMLHSINPESRVFSLDTGRLNDETYECAENISRRYGVRIEWYFPAREDVESLERTKGLYSFRLSVENRKECCGIRKVEPLNRALSGLDAWITGQRKAQSVTRTELTVVEEDVVHGGIAKINPLADWSLDQVKNFVREHSIPYNNLHERGYPSIGCAPCTRAVAPGENERAGRWWWEHPEHKECGLHLPFQQGDGI
ncbi:MAG: phosphoadenylyl-sulfate reductase [Verrucomicrobia bacterium]|nr:phosphoadenylyl-sulfate reductase [Verrucomicrobiota bacterium]